MYFKIGLCSALTLFSCNKIPTACAETSEIIYLGEAAWLSNTCSQNQHKTIINWGDNTSDTIESKKTGFYTHTYLEEGVYLGSVTVFSRKSDIKDVELFTIQVVSPNK